MRTIRLLLPVAVSISLAAPAFSQAMMEQGVLYGSGVGAGAGLGAGLQRLYSQNAHNVTDKAATMTPAEKAIQFQESSLAGQARAAEKSGRLAEAAKLYSELAQMRQRYHGEYDALAGMFHEKAAAFEIKRGEFGQAEASLRAALSVQAHLNGSTSWQCFPILKNLAECCSHNGNERDAASFYRLALTSQAHNEPDDSLRLNQTRTALANSLLKSGDGHGAETTFHQSIVVAGKHADFPDTELAKLLQGYAAALKLEKKTQEAATAERQANQLLKQSELTEGQSDGSASQEKAKTEPANSPAGGVKAQHATAHSAPHTVPTPGHALPASQLSVTKAQHSEPTASESLATDEKSTPSSVPSNPVTESASHGASGASASQAASAATEPATITTTSTTDTAGNTLPVTTTTSTMTTTSTTGTSPDTPMPATVSGTTTSTTATTTSSTASPPAQLAPSAATTVSAGTPEPSQASAPAPSAPMTDNSAHADSAPSAPSAAPPTPAVPTETAAAPITPPPTVASPTDQPAGGEAKAAPAVAPAASPSNSDMSAPASN